MTAVENVTGGTGGADVEVRSQYCTLGVWPGQADRRTCDGCCNVLQLAIVPLRGVRSPLQSIVSSITQIVLSC
jgi:hypothetical protein